MALATDPNDDEEEKYGFLVDVVAIFLRLHRKYRVNQMDTGGNRPDIPKFAVVEGCPYLDFYNSGGRINSVGHLISTPTNPHT